MRKSSIRNDRPDRIKSPLLSPLVSAMRGALGELGRLARQPSRKPAQVAPAAAVRFEPIEPRVLLSDANPAALTVNGTIGVPGEQDQYQFTVEESRRVVFDSLTNRSDLSWKLDGPAGSVTSRSFSNTDYNASSPAFELTPGKYVLTVDGSQDAVGDYSLRVVDADAAADLTPGTAVTGTLDGGNKTDVYRFSATAGDKFYFKGGALQSTGSYPYADWRLIDPYGRQEGGTGNLTQDRDAFSVQCTGEYLLLVEGAGSNTAPVSYQFNLQTVSDTTAPLALNTATTANIDQAGKTANYTFTLSEETPVLFDSLSSSAFYWSLTGPAGQQVSRHLWSDDTSYTNGFERFLLPAGDYTLSVDASYATTGSYGFRLLTAAGAQDLASGAEVSATLDNARGSQLYKVSLSAGDKVYFDGRAVAGGGVNWRLIDPFGTKLASQALMTAVDPVTVQATGDYWLVIDGSEANAADAAVSYRFALNKVPDVLQSITADGTEADGNIDTAGQAIVYSFTLAASTQLAFDSLSNRSDLQWSLSGPRGTEVSDRRFDQSEGTGVGILPLPAGNYRLTVRGKGSATGSFAFRLLDFGSAAGITTDVPVTGTLSPGNGSLAYRLTAAAGDKIAFQSNSVNGGSATWRLIDRYGRDVAGSNNLASARAAFVLTTGGDYTLLIEGALANTAAVEFSVQFNASGNQAPTPLPAGDALAFGTLASGTMAAWDATKTYRFTLTADSLLVMDTQNQNGSSAIWTLVGPRGTEVDQRQLYTSDASYSNPVLALPAGDYALTVKGSSNTYFWNSGAYSFRLLDASAFSSLMLGQQVTATRTPSNATLGYRFEATAGSNLVLNWSDSGYSSLWTLIDPFGRAVTGVNGDSYGTTYGIGASGTYTLINEGYYYASGSTNVTFTLSEQDRSIAPLVFDDQLSGTLAGRQSLAEYDFTLDRTTSLVFDSLDTTGGNNNVQWMLRGPKGTVAGWSTATSASILGALPPGKYSLVLRNAKDTAVDYRFRVLDRDAAVALIPGEAVNDSLPAGEARLYRFNGNAGEHYYFDGQNYYYGTNELCYCKIVDPYGRLVFSNSTSNDTTDFALQATGEYLMLVYPASSYYSQAGAGRTAKFNLLLKPSTNAVLTLGQDMSGTTTRPAESVKYSFTLTAPAQILVDGWDGAGFSWSLSGPRGSEASGNSLSNSPRLFRLPAGNYEFTVAADSLNFGSFHFRITDLASIVAVPLNTAAHMSLASNDRSQAYLRFDLAENGQLAFDAGGVNPYSSWRVYDALGQVQASGNLYNLNRLNLLAGTYYLVYCGGTVDQPDFDLAVRTYSSKSAALPLGQRIDDQLDQPAQENTYSFDISARTIVMFESLGSDPDLVWQLTGPSGSVSSGSFASNDIRMALSTAGHYALKVSSQSFSAKPFAFRMIDVASAAQALPVGASTVTLEPADRTRIFGFDVAAGQYFSYKFGTLAASASVSCVLLDSSGNYVGSFDSRYDYTRSLAAGHYHLILSADISSTSAVDLGLTVAVSGNHERDLAFGTDAVGSIDAQGLSDTWNFTLNASRRVVFDALSGTGVSWSLLNAAGTTLRSGDMRSPAIFDLGAGDYRLAVTGAGYTVPGAYGFRLLDAADAADLAESVASPGTLPETHAAALYRLSAAAGTSWFISAETAASGGRLWVFDSNGGLVGAPAMPASALEIPTLSQDKDYIVVVDNSIDNAGAIDYTLTATRATEITESAALGDILAATIDTPNTFRSYRLNLAGNARFVISNAGSDAGMRWRLTPVGSVPAGWQNLSDSGFYSDAQYVAGGEYTLTFASGNPAATAFRVQLLDLDAATTLDPAGASAVLADGRDAIAYAFDLASSQRVTVDLATADPAQLSWALYRDGYRLQSVDAGIARDTDDLEAGHYVLVLYGRGAEGQSVDYSLVLQPIGAASMSLGDVVTTAFPATGDCLDFEFSLPSPTQVMFDALAGSPNFRYEIYDPFSQWTVASGYFTADTQYGTRLIGLDARTYRLRIFRPDTSAQAATAEDVAFRLMSLDQAETGPTDVGVPLTGTLVRGSESVARRFDAVAGDKISVTLDSVQGGDIAWRLLDSANNLVGWYGWEGNSNIRVTQSGRYTLLVDGDVGNTGPVDYQFTVSVQPPVDTRPPGDTLELGSAPIDAIIPPGGLTYRFTLAQATLVTVSGDTGYIYTPWRIQGLEDEMATGSIYEPGIYANSCFLAAGDYAISFENSNSSDIDASLRIEDGLHASVVSPEADIVTTGPRLFAVNLDAGQTLFYRSPGEGSWDIYGPNGNYAGGAYSNEQNYGSFAAPIAGTYYITLSRDYTACANGTSLELRQFTEQVQELTLGTTVTGTPDQLHSVSYTFSVTEGRPFLFDISRTQGWVPWSLTRDGEPVSDGYWAQTGFDWGGDSILYLDAGNYCLTTRDYEYDLTVVDLTQAEDAILGGQTAVTVAPGTCVVRRVGGQIGDSFLYAPESVNGSGNWQLLDESGNFIAGDDIGNNSACLDLPYTGSYYLVWSANPGESTAPVDYSFTLDVTAPPPAVAIPALGEPVTGTLADDGTARFSLHLEADTQIYVDALNLSSASDWQVFDNAGTFVLAGNTDSPSINRLAAGDYVLRFMGTPFSGEEVSFRVMDVQASVTAAAGDVAGTLAAGNAAIYQCTISEGQSLVFDPADFGGMTGRYAVLDANGAQRYLGYAFDTPAAVRGLPAGDYYLVLDAAADSPAASANIQFRFGGVSASAPVAMTIATGIADALDEDGTRRFSFDTDGPGLFWLEVQSGFAGTWYVEDAQGSVIASGGGNHTDGGLIRIAAAGSYTLSIAANMLPPAGNRDLALRLFDFAAAAVSISMDVRTEGTLDSASRVAVYSFDASATDVFRFISSAIDSSGVVWRLYSPSGSQILSGDASVTGGLYSLSPYGSGRYYLVIDGSASASSTIHYAFTAGTNRIALDTLYSGYASYYSPATYPIHLDQPALLVFDALKTGSFSYADYYLYWTLTGSDGQVFGTQTLYQNDPIRMLPAGDYTLKLYSNYYWYSPAYQFRIQTRTGMESVTPGTTVSGTLNPGSATKLYRLDATAGETYYFRGLQSISGAWRLFDPDGNQIFNGYSLTDQNAITLAKTGSYILSIEGSNSVTTAQSYSFAVVKPVDMGTVALNATVSDSVPGGTLRRFNLHLDQDGVLVFDSLGSNSNVNWRLEGANGVVFDRAMTSYSNTDYGMALAAGDYSLILKVSGTGTSPYSFRVLDRSGATPIVPGTPVTASVTPVNGARLFTFDAVAGERYYFDVLSSLSFDSNSTPYWSLLDPLGQRIFGSTDTGYFNYESYMLDPATGTYRYRYKLYGYDQEPAALSKTGTYTLVLEGANSRTASMPPLTFNVVKVPNNPPVVLDSLLIRPAPDLAINNVTLDPAAGLQSGQQLTIGWVEENRGQVATATNWNDRIIVRNLDTGKLVANITVPYDAAQDGAIGSGESRTRSAAIRLPDGSNAVGRLSFTIMADADNLIRESNLTGTAEGNNAMTVEATVELAPYADLVAEDFVLAPAGDYQPGETVSVSWNTANRGNVAVAAPWSERLEVRNLSTNALVASVAMRDDLTDGALAAGATRQRSTSFAWPTGVDASGRFSIRVVLDAAGEIAEANSSGTGESNDIVEALRDVGPDLQIRNLQLVTTDLQAGGFVTIQWEDWNLGASATGMGFDDRVTVRNLGSNAVLLDTSVPYDPALQNNGPILPGQSRQRSFTFRLPDGLRGTGDIGITVSADQNAGGVSVLHETNLTNDAEKNNTASVAGTAAGRSYADLRTGSVGGDVAGVGGEPVNVSWTVANNGQADATGDWNDQIIFSTDTTIGNADDVVIGTVRHTGGLAQGASYAQTTSVRVPMRSAGRYYLAVKTDSGAEVVEPDTRADNVSGAHAIDLAEAYSDLNTLSVTAPEAAMSGENVLVTWVVRNDGNATTDLALWNDRVILSTDPVPSGDDIVIAGSITHAGLLSPGQSYTGKATITLPRDLQGQFYVIVDTNSNRSVNEKGLTANNATATPVAMRVGLAPTPDLTVSAVTGSTMLRPGDTASVTYTLANNGAAAAVAPWRDRIYIDRGASGLYEIASVFNTDNLDVGATQQRTVNVAIPTWFWEGDFRWVVRTDTDNAVFERNAEDNNQGSSTDVVRISRTDLAVTDVRADALVQSGTTVHVEWTIANQGGTATANWVDQVFLSKGGTLKKVADVAHSGPLASGDSYVASADVAIPLDYSGDYEIVVVTDAGQVINDHDRTNNRSTKALSVDLAPYADLTVTSIVAPTQVIDDPAPLDVSWTVMNQGTGAGRTGSWTDRIVLSRDDTYGNGDDWVIGEYRHDGGLAAGDSYTRNVQVLLPPATVGRYKMFVVTDAKSEVFENGLEANDIARVAHDVDVMAIPYADLQVQSVTADAAAASGRPLHVTWSVINDGIGITNSAEWTDTVWLSRNPDGKDVVKQLGSFDHIGQLAVGDGYTRSADVLLPDGIEGDYYVNVRTGGPFEFIFTDNDTNRTVAVPVTLSKSPDLAVESVTLPASAQEGSVIDVSWTVVNQGEAAASGVWVDSVWLVPASGVGSPVSLGSFSYDRGLESGIRYSRTEQVRLPAKIEGLYRIKVVTNANLGGSGNQVYEHGAARSNNALLSADVTQVNLNDRPDLRVGTVTAPDHVIAGGSASVNYTIINQGAAATSGRWTDKVFLSLDATLSADDRLVGQFGNGSALAPTESYANESASVDIPITYRGDAYLIVVADGNYNVDEYPNEANNVKAAHIYVDPVPFSDLVTSDVVAPDQAIHGSSIEVRYKVANLGSATTRGIAANTNSWTDSVWLTRDRTRPSPGKGDVMIGQVTHTGNLAIGEDYLGTMQVTIPDGTLSGNYYITVWSDTYDAILEDTLATNLNPDDPHQTDNNNYKARPISVLGLTPPDLAVTEVTAPATANGGDGSYSFSYTVQNRGDVFSGAWTDSYYVSDNPDLSKAKLYWLIGSCTQNRTMANGERYTVTQTVALDPAVHGAYLVVKTDANSNVRETDESNNAGNAGSIVTAHPADLVVTSVETQPENFSGEDTTITWTVTNQGEAVWAGTRGWVDSIFISTDPTFIPDRATALGAVVHSNAEGLGAGASYTASAKVKLPPGTDGLYYIYILTDSEHSYGALSGSPNKRISREYVTSDGTLDRAGFYSASAYEGFRNDNNVSRGDLNITYREPDLQVNNISVSDPTPHSGETVTVTWTVTNYGTRETRTNTWFDGIYLSRDASLDNADYPLVDRGSEVEGKLRVSLVSLYENNKPKYLKPGESYTQSETFTLPESISGDFNIIVKTDTSTTKSYYGYVSSTVRDGLDVLDNNPNFDSVKEFKDEGNNVKSIALPITLATPPDLQVSQVTAADSVIAGQAFTVNYTVVNSGGATPSDQSSWYDLVYLSKDRFLDVSQDRYLGYIQHNGGLAANGSYGGTLTVTAPRDLEGPYYVFVVTDPARTWGTGEYGRVREFGKEQNNATTAAQPIVVQTPPPADLKVTGATLPASANVGDDIRIDYTITNDSINPAYGRWTDAIYLSSDNAWDLGDVLLGKVDHIGDLGAHGSYTGSLTVKLPPVKDGNWRIIVRPDLYNDVFEGKISYTATGLNLPPGEANNRTASGDAMQVHVPVLTVGSPLATTLVAGQSRLYKLSVAAGETLRVLLDSSAESGSNEVYIRYGDIPTAYAYDAAYSNPVAADQEAVIPSTQAGDYYVLVRARQGAETPVTIRADLAPLSITQVTPDQGGTGDDAHRWVTLDIYGTHFKAGALVKLSRPGIYEVEPDRWQVLDATHIRAVFDMRKLPHGLYDVSVANPDGQVVTEANRYLVERGIEADVTIGVGGLRNIGPGDNDTFSVSLQSLTNVDTPYVRFDYGVSNMGYNTDLIEGLNLPYVVFGTNLGGRPAGVTTDTAGNTQTYGQTPTSMSRTDIPWAKLDGVDNTSGFDLAPGYAFDVAANGYVGMTFNVQTYPGLAEWMAYDFPGLRDKLYALHPEWKAQGLLDGGPQDLDNISAGLTAKFLSTDPETHLTKKEALAEAFQFNIVGAATPITRDEFIADQTAHAKQLRQAILADATAPSSLAVLAADEGQWVNGWLGALELAGLLRPVDQAPPIRENPEVLSLNATLATGILLSKSGESYQTQADLLGFFAKVQQWYGDTAKYAGDPNAAKVATDHMETRTTSDGESVEVPVPVMADPAAFDQNATHDTHFLNFDVFAGGQAEMEYLRHIGLLDAEFNPLPAASLNLTQYLQQAAQQNVDSQAVIAVRAPQGAAAADGSAYVPAATALPYKLSFNNPSQQPAGQLRIVTQLDANLDPRSVRLTDLKLGDINVHIPAGRANSQGDFDFTGSKGFILRVSAGVDAAS
ncbi:MAG TPA: CARDB domain-containing protein, partial [Rhodocyclaceae bacterium]